MVMSFVCIVLYMGVIRELFISFIAGSSFPSFVILFVVVASLFRVRQALFDYYDYSIKAPMLLGLMAVFAKALHIYAGVSLRYAYFIVSLLSAFGVMYNITFTGPTYKFESNARWYLQYFLILTGHLIIYNLIIYNIDVYLTSCV